MRLMAMMIAIGLAGTAAASEPSPDTTSASGALKALCAVVCGTWRQSNPVAPDQGSTIIEYRPDGAQITATERTSGTFDGKLHETRLAIKPVSGGEFDVTRSSDDGAAMTGHATLNPEGFKIITTTTDGSVMTIAELYDGQGGMTRTVSLAMKDGQAVTALPDHFQR